MEAGIIVLWILAAVLVGGGVAGLVLPVLPGPPMIFVGLVLAAWAEDFAHVGRYTIAVLALLAIIAVSVDFLAGVFGAKHFGASRRAMAGAAVGAFIGLFFGIPGIVFGPFIGAVIGELSVRKDLFYAGIAGLGAWLGLAVGIAAKVAIGFVMIGLFLIIRFI
ncbi:MAG: DUF456 domain-containing protein [Desulfosalsimonadaceae bacterium]